MFRNRIFRNLNLTLPSNRRLKIQEHRGIYKIIQYPSGDRYEGFTENYLPHGVGTLYKENSCKIHAHWTMGHIDATSQISIKWDHDDVIEGTLNAALMANTKVLFFLHASHSTAGQLRFTGMCHFHTDRLIICKDQGTVFVKGKKRATGIFVNNHLSDISLLFDEDGDLVLVNSEGILSEFDGEWPTTMEGSMSVHKGEEFLYKANFHDGSIRNIFEVANISKVRVVTSIEEITDPISMEVIPFGEIAFELNSPHHVVSKSTLKLLRSTKNLRKHPCTRAPVLRISRVKYVKGDHVLHQTDVGSG